MEGWCARPRPAAHRGSGRHAAADVGPGHLPARAEALRGQPLGGQLDPGAPHPPTHGDDQVARRDRGDDQEDHAQRRVPGAERDRAADGSAERHPGDGCAGDDHRGGPGDDRDHGRSPGDDAVATTADCRGAARPRKSWSRASRRPAPASARRGRRRPARCRGSSRSRRDPRGAAGPLPAEGVPADGASGARGRSSQSKSPPMALPNDSTPSTIAPPVSSSASTPAAAASTRSPPSKRLSTIPLVKMPDPGTDDGADRRPDDRHGDQRADGGAGCDRGAEPEPTGDRGLHGVLAAVDVIGDACHGQRTTELQRQRLAGALEVVGGPDQVVRALARPVGGVEVGVPPGLADDPGVGVARPLEVLR